MAIVSESFAPQERKKGKDGQYERPGGVVARCDCMQNTLLRAKDYELYIHLQSQHIEPQLYSMKWIRLLLGREFHLEDVLVLWDAMFADHHKATSKGARFDSQDPKIKIIHFIAPKVWAWREGRVKKMKKFLDHILLLFKFEKEYFDKEKIAQKMILLRMPLIQVEGFLNLK